MRDLAAAKAQGDGIALQLLARLRARRIRLLQAQIQAIDAAIADTIAADPELAAQAAILVSIPGFGAVSAAALLAEMPELGRLEPKAAASLAGLAPVDRASGTSARRARIRGGRWSVRRALFMPAPAAARHNPDLAARYKALRTAGPQARPRRSHAKDAPARQRTPARQQTLDPSSSLTRTRILFWREAGAGRGPSRCCRAV